MLPNFFSSAAPGLIDRLWDFAKSAYLDNPLPFLFKERLFVHLSRFCPVRYCIVRHLGFLTGFGRPAGDPAASPQTVEQGMALKQAEDQRQRAEQALVTTTQIANTLMFDMGQDPRGPAAVVVGIGIFRIEPDRLVVVRDGVVEGPADRAKRHGQGHILC